MRALAYVVQTILGALMKRRLSCCVCGDDAGRWQQHWNRDTGYGVCVKCIGWARDRAKQYRGGLTPENVEAEIADLYGREGVNWGCEVQQ